MSLFWGDPSARGRVPRWVDHASLRSLIYYMPSSILKALGLCAVGLSLESDSESAESPEVLMALVRAAY